MSTKTIWFDPEAEEHLVSVNSRVLAFERENVFDDGGFVIEWQIDTATFFIDQGDEGVVHFLFIDATTHGVAVTPVLYLDDVGDEITLPTFSSTSREIHEFPINRKCRRLQLRLGAEAFDRVEIHGVTIDTRGGSGRVYRE